MLLLLCYKNVDVHFRIAEFHIRIAEERDTVRKSNIHPGLIMAL